MSYDQQLYHGDDDDAATGSSSSHGLEMRVSRARTSPSTFGLSTRKPRLSPPALPFHSSSNFQTETEGSTSESYHRRRCCQQHDSGAANENARDTAAAAAAAQGKVGGGHYDDPEPSWVAPLSPRPNRKRNSGGGSRPEGLRSNTKTSFTADGDRVEEFKGEGRSLRIGTHWDEEAAEASRKEWMWR